MYIEVVKVGFFVGNVGFGSLTSERDMSVYRASCVQGGKDTKRIYDPSASTAEGC